MSATGRVLHALAVYKNTTKGSSCACYNVVATQSHTSAPTCCQMPRHAANGHVPSHFSCSCHRGFTLSAGLVLISVQLLSEPFHFSCSRYSQVLRCAAALQRVAAPQSRHDLARAYIGCTRSSSSSASYLKVKFSLRR